VSEKLADQVATIEADTASMVLNAIQHPVIMVDANSVVCFANWEAESFFAASAAHLGRHKLDAYSVWKPAARTHRTGARTPRRGQRVPG
jgi:two-component system nitrogen regulation sensor histidine kinase GlnL